MPDYLLKDHYFLKAKEEGLKSRAAYKLIEINNKHRILKKGKMVLDLGAAPGGWLQIAANSVGKKGFVFAVDKVPFDMPKRDNIALIKADIQDPDGLKEITEQINGKVDVVLSDMAPKLSGIKNTDDSRIFDLAQTAFEICMAFLKPNGHFLIKLFDSALLPDYRSQVKLHFDQVNLIVPKARRRSSSEVYLLAKKFKPGKS